MVPIKNKNKRLWRKKLSNTFMYDSSSLQSEKVQGREF